MAAGAFGTQGARWCSGMRLGNFPSFEIDQNGASGFASSERLTLSHILDQTKRRLN